MTRLGQRRYSDASQMAMSCLKIVWRKDWTWQPVLRLVTLCKQIYSVHPTYASEYDDSCGKSLCQCSFQHLQPLFNAEYDS